MPAVGQLEAAQPPLRGAGEGALLVAEQLALQQRLGQAAQLTAMNGLPAPRREVVDGLGDQLLAGARLALDQHRARHRRHLLDLDQHFLDRPRSRPRCRCAAAAAGAATSRRATATTSSASTGLVITRGGAEPRDPLRALGVGRLEQRQRRHLAPRAPCATSCQRRRLVHRAGQDEQRRVARGGQHRAHVVHAPRPSWWRSRRASRAALSGTAVSRSSMVRRICAAICSSALRVR